MKQAYVKKKLYHRYLCRTIQTQLNLHVFMHNILISFKTKLRFVKVFLHICLMSTAFFGLTRNIANYTVIPVLKHRTFYQHKGALVLKTDKVILTCIILFRYAI